ncbi:MAG: hypothetical protein ACRDI2_03160 [Chloroflexota bacterium]
MEPARQMVFVAHRVAGVHLVPSDWLEGFRPSGFREATAAEIAFWYEERGLEPPAVPLDGQYGYGWTPAAQAIAPPTATVTVHPLRP